ncbi:MAG: alpha/beta hydrolase [Anaerolineales bacterium]
MQTQMIEVNGVRLHVATDGEENAPPVVLLHGFPEFHHGWRKQIPALVAAGFRVIVPDQRGYNLSDKPKSVSAYAVDALAKDVIGLLDHFGIQKVKLVGHDWGAAVAWTVALNHPERVEKLAILNVPHPDVMTRFILRNAAQRKKSWYIYFFQIPFLPEWILSRNDFRNLARMLVGSGKKGTFTREDISAYKTAWAQRGALRGMINWYRAIVRASLKNLFGGAAQAARRVQPPALILWGKRDVALSHEMVQPSLELCEDGRAVFFENATHWVQHDEADAVNEELRKFFLH